MKTVPLYGKVAAGRVALVDDEDYELVMQYRWHAFESMSGGRVVNTYAATARTRSTAGPRSILMHALITGTLGTDHFNHNGLDNQRENLRAATISQNQGNRRGRRGGTSQYKGVSWGKREKRWIARLVRDGKLRLCRLFDSEEDAARAYDAAARQVFGPFACLNFPGPGESAAQGAGNLDATAGTPGEVRGPARGASRYVGVTPREGSWVAMIVVSGRRRQLGTYASEIEAALAYDAAARELHGEKASLNFPGGLSPELEVWILTERAAGKAEAAARWKAGLEARSDWWRQREPVQRTCEECGGDYQTNAVQATMYCGKRCCDRARQRRRREERAGQAA